ncbi:hypothetical protein Barb6XT_02778 [Bacteroidales bacterium Barb6XT]|nr:hypothetical protein Barb6XT_02778 [Bacteroidales bacterium Barb6XT]
MAERQRIASALNDLSLREVNMRTGHLYDPACIPVPVFAGNPVGRCLLAQFLNRHSRQRHNRPPLVTVGLKLEIIKVLPFAGIIHCTQQGASAKSPVVYLYCILPVPVQMQLLHRIVVKYPPADGFHPVRQRIVMPSDQMVEHTVRHLFHIQRHLLYIRRRQHQKVKPIVFAVKSYPVCFERQHLSALQIFIGSYLGCFRKHIHLVQYTALPVLKVLIRVFIFPCFLQCVKIFQYCFRFLFIFRKGNFHTVNRRS